MADEVSVTDGFQELCLLAWEFLLRVKAEGCPIEVGDANEVKNSKLRDSRHSALWVSGAERVVHLRLKRRKHRPLALHLQHFEGILGQPKILRLPPGAKLDRLKNSLGE